MSAWYSRRDFLTGVLATSTLSAGVIYFLPGGRLPQPSSRVELRLVTGDDSTGARQLLFDTWNRANPNIQVRVSRATGNTMDQKNAMIDAAADGAADIINPDIIHLPDLGERGIIAEIELENSLGVLPVVRRASATDATETTYWGAPFNADAGMLFERLPDVGADPSNDQLSDVIDRAPRNESPEFVGQLYPEPSAAHEAFVVNVLEHALSRRAILDENGMPVEELTDWQDAMEPLREAVTGNRIVVANTEDETSLEFTGRGLRFMRNWPVHFRQLQLNNDQAVRESRIVVRPLPLGILGGQSLALVRGTRHTSEALALIQFLTSDDANKVLAAHGLAPTRSAAYNDSNLRAFIPHLEEIRTAVETARPRPIHRNYSEFSAVVRRHMTTLLQADVDLPSQFIDEMRAVL